MGIMRYYRTITDGIGEAITAGTAVTALVTLAPRQDHGVAVGLSVLLTVLGVAKVAYGVLVKDEPLLAEIAGDVEQAAPQVVEQVGGARTTTAPPGGSPA